jgi:hypothetical protein
MASCNVVSLCSNLEPIAGISFALNLAYLGLQRFRYRQAIKEHVSKSMGELSNASQNTKDTRLYKAIARLSSLSETDRKLFKSSDKNANLTGAWSFFYERLFECNQDRIITILGSLLSALVIILGVFHSTNASCFAENLFKFDYISYWICGIILAQVLPVSFVVLGNFVVSGAKQFSENHIEDLKKTMKDQAANAKVPPANAARFLDRSPIEQKNS